MTRPLSEKDRLTRIESTMAEILRQNYPLTISGDAGMMWLDIVEDMAKVFATKKPRFDSDGFYNACFGEEMRISSM